MKKLCTFMALLAVLFLYTGTGFATGLLTEDFNYTAGDSINNNGTHGWIGHSGTGGILVVSPGLTYAGYLGSGVGNACLVDNNTTVDVHKDLSSTVSSGSVYASAMISISTTSAVNTYFFHFGSGTSGFTAKVFARPDAVAGYDLGITKAANTATTWTSACTYGQTYFIVIKYTYVAGTANDVCDLFLNPALGGSEPAVTITAGDPTGADFGTITGIYMRQANGIPVAKVDGIRVGTAWADVVPASVPALSSVPSTITGLTYITGAGPSTGTAYTLSGTNLTGSGNIVVTAPNTNFEVSLSLGSGYASTVNVPYTGPTLAGTSVYVRLAAGLAINTYGPSNVTNVGGGASLNVPVSGYVDAAQQLTASTHVINSGLDYYFGAGPSSPAQTFNLSGSSLTGYPGNILVTAPSHFEVSLSSGSGFGANVSVPYTSATLASTPIYVRLAAGLAAATYGPVNVACTGGGALEEDVAVTGNVLVQSLTLTPTGSNIVTMSYVLGSDSTGAMTYFLVGANLSGFPGNITVTAPSNFVVSNALYGTYGTTALVPFTSATLASTGVYVKLAHGLAVGPYSGNLSWSGGGVSTQSIAITGSVAAVGVSLSETFDSYPLGNLAGNDGWVAHSSPGSTPPQVVTPGLAYAGIADGSGVGNAVSMLTGEDDNHQFTNVHYGVVYASAIVNVTAQTSTAGDYFIHFGDAGTYDYYARLYTKASGAGFVFGILQYAGGTTTWGTTVHAFNTPCLIVLKYAFPNGVNPSVATLYVNPTPGGTETSTEILATTGVPSTECLNISGIFLRQGGASTAPNVLVDAIKVGQTWAQVTPASGCTLTLTALIEAMYVSGGTAMTMTPDVTVELHDAVSLAVVESKTATLSTAGVGTFNFTTAVNGTPYYLVVKSLNTIETWSASTVTFSGGALSYDFTTGLDKAYTDGSNPPLALHGSKYCIYSGDVNQDGNVTGDDYTGVDNDNFNYDYHLVNDVNGDGNVTGDDYTFIDNNNFNYIGRQIPPGAPSAAKRVVRSHNSVQKNSLVK